MTKQARSIQIDGYNVDLTNEEKVLFPSDNITKGDLICYYKKMGKRIISKISNRLIMMDRYPDGLQGEHWMQKNIATYFPKWVVHRSVGKQAGENINMMVCNNVASLVYIANQACITPHVWLSRIDKLDYPDRMIFDLDPPEGPTQRQFKKVINTALDLKEILEKQLKLPTYVLLTGSKGVHVVVPLKREHKFVEVRAFARKVATYMAKGDPKNYTVNPRKDTRKGKVFIDYLRNAYAQTVVAPYAVRAINGAPIAMPISWPKLTKVISSQEFTMKNISKNLILDPWDAMDKKAASLKTIQKRLDDLLEKDYE